MKIHLRSVILLVTELLVVGYVSWVVYLLSTWMVDDAVAARMAPMDWYSTAAKRLGLSLVVGAAVAGAVHDVNRRWVVAPFGGSRRHAVRAALVLGACVVLAGVLGATRFVIVRPFM
ncbi:hypothetical protein [Luteitalea sp.]